MKPQDMIFTRREMLERCGMGMGMVGLLSLCSAQAVCRRPRSTPP